ncbi:MAG: flavin reductase family protein [Planctomycetes bacterium]|nr:flavin reductase family protein [Planctomycetota bacterium]
MNTERRSFLKTAATMAAGMVIAGLPASSQGRAAGQAGTPGGWQPIEPEAIADNPFRLLRRDWLALAAGAPNDMNAMTISWGALGTLWGRSDPTVTVYVEPSRYTHGYMERNEFFTVTALAEPFRKALEYIGSRSGREERDKVANAGLTVAFTDRGNPFLAEGRLVMECRKVYTAPLDPAGMGEKGTRTYSGRMRPHTMFIGEVVGAWQR